MCLELEGFNQTVTDTFAYVSIKEVAIPFDTFDFARAAWIQFTV